MTECSSPYRKLSLISVHICSPFKSQIIQKAIIKTYINENKTTTNICSVLDPISTAPLDEKHLHEHDVTIYQAGR